jgi:hypothetical protein
LYAGIRVFAYFVVKTLRLATEKITVGLNNFEIPDDFFEFLIAGNFASGSFSDV